MDITQPFRTLGVVGAGNMGSGIAQKMATEGFDVLLVDVDDEKVARGMGTIRQTLGAGVERGLFTQDAVQATLDRIRGTSRLEDLAPADLVVEAVFEDFQVKSDVFRRLNEVCRADAILATNTSSFSVTELAASAGAWRVVGLHYFYHPARNRLVEVIPGAATDPDVLRRAWMLQEMLGKTSIASRDAYGFVVNRFFAPWLTEAVRLSEEGGVTTATVDAAAKGAFGIGMGPFELMNVTGIPIAFHTATTLGRAFGRMYEPPPLLRAQMESGSPWALDGEPDRAAFPLVTDRLSAAVFCAAGALVDEGVGSIEDVDIGARVGLRWRQGPFETMNRLGLDRAAALAGQYAAVWGVPLPAVLADQARAGKPFAFRLVRSETRDGVARLTLNRPDAMNALDELLVGQLAEAFRAAVSDPEVHGIVIAGSGKAFVAGADIRFFLRNLEAGTMTPIVEFTRKGQALLREMETCPKPVIARLHGIALGGGAELALACHAIVASPRASLGFPETGIGIYPGLGGTQRTTRRVGKGLAKWLVLTGEIVGAEEALAIGLVDRVVSHEQLDKAIDGLIATAGLAPRPPVLPETHRPLAEFFGKYDPDTLRAGRADTGGDVRLQKAQRRVGTKAPTALRLAAELIDQGAGLPLEEGLRLELAHLEEIFSTRDAREGLSSVGRARPVFEGR